jgi:dTDP-4-dehydrorhamnose reductase
MLQLAEALWRFAEKQDLCGVYHFTDNGVASWHDFAVAIQEEALSQSLLSSEMEVIPISTADYVRPTSLLRRKGGSDR